MKNHLILILPLLIGCAAPLYHCEEENVYKEIPVLSEFCFGHGICNHQEYVKVLDHKYTECYPERKDNDD